MTIDRSDLLPVVKASNELVRCCEERRGVSLLGIDLSGPDFQQVGELFDNTTDSHVRHRLLAEMVEKILTLADFDRIFGIIL